MYKKTTLSFIFSLLTLITVAQNYPRDYFQKPLDIPLILSGTFGELRSNHFHAGIDIKTNGVEGLAVRAAADGHIVRIAVSPYGYGNAIYIRHPNGYTTVYAHLQRFTEHIAEWVESEQYDRESFNVNLFPPAGKFPVSKGDIIALSGNSGGSGGPHLHFEIRDARTEEPINPLLFGFDVPDHRAPTINAIYAYPLDDNGHLNQRHARTSLSLKTIREGEYAIKWPQRGLGPIGFSIETIDRLDGAWNSNGPYSISQYVNDEKNAEFIVERLSFAETRYINAHMDYDLYSCCNDKVNRMWILPGNHLRAYRSLHNNGVVDVQVDSTYELRWEIKDVAGNTTVLTGTLRGEALTSSPAPLQEGTTLAFDQPNFGSIGNFTYQMETGCLYEDVTTTLEELESIPNGYGPVYRLGTRSIPVHKHFYVQLPLSDVPEKYRNQVVVVSLDDDLTRPDSWDGEILNGKLGSEIKAKVRAMGPYTLMIDSVPPSLRVIRGVSNGATLSRGSEIQLKISDDLSGIQSYTCTIDDQWYLMSYDAKNNLLRVELTDRISAGNHTLKFEAVDDRGNVTTLTYTFTYRR
ncbi:MAG: M23 family peptidase [Bacteroidetes bacterium]|nr:MAG: M23 family peptidase [Bacteroidota bacterium]